MQEIKIGEIPIFQFEQLKGNGHLIHFITTRQGGVSKGDYQSFNFSYKVGDNRHHVSENRKTLAGLLAINPLKILFPDQCHTSHIMEVTNSTISEDLTETDALITNCKNLCIVVLAADCVPILLYDPISRATGIVHSGWKGTVGRIAARTIEQMARRYGSKPKDILACIGPSISQKYYEVGDEVARQFKFWYADTPSIFISDRGTGKTHIDLWKANRQLLMRCGVQSRNIELSNICTYDNPGLFFSARRDGIQSGRFAAGIILT